MYSTYDGAKRRAKSLQATLRRLDILVALGQCQRAMARGGNYRDWDHLRRVLSEGAQAAPLDGFQERARVAVPAMATGPANRWLDVELSRLRERAKGEPALSDETGDWYVYVHEYAFAIGVQHQALTPLLKGGRGMRLRQSLVQDLAIGRLAPAFDPETLVLTSQGTLREIFPGHVDKAGFRKAFADLVEAGICEVLSEEGGVLTIALHPPPKALVLEHVNLCRRLDADYYENPSAPAAWRAAPDRRRRS